MNGASALLQALKQAPLEQQVLAALRQDGGGELLGVSHQHHPAYKIYTQVLVFMLCIMPVGPTGGGGG